MPKIYTIFCIAVLGLYGYANARGIVYSSCLTGNGTAQKAASARYHK